MNLLEKLYDHLQTHEFLKLAKIEAVHRFYYDHCFDPYTLRPYNTNEFDIISNLHQTLHCENPDWRYNLKRKLIRYDAWEPTNALIIDAKSKNLFILDAKYEILEAANKANKQMVP